MNWRDHIHSAPDVLLGKPVVRGTRISVELILELLGSGWTEAMLLESYLTLSPEALRAVFLYLRECMQDELYFSAA